MKVFQPSLIPSVALIAMIAVGGYFLVKNSSKKVTEEEQPAAVNNEQSAELINRSRVSEETYKVSDKYATFDVKYPQFKNADEAFNKKIENFIFERIMEHKKISAENWQYWKDSAIALGGKVGELPKESEKFTFVAYWKPIQANDNFISFIFTLSGYTGGAHGYTEIVSFNYDVKNKKEIALRDLFPTDSNYLKTISDFSRKDLQIQIKNKLEDGGWFEDEKTFQENNMPSILRGTEPNKENFSVFTFTPDEVTIYFAQYQVAAYAMGMFEVTIPRK